MEGAIARDSIFEFAILILQETVGGCYPKSVIRSQSQRMYNIINDSILRLKALNQFAALKPIKSAAIGSDPYVVWRHSADGNDRGSRVQPGQLPRNCEWRLLKLCTAPPAVPTHRTP